MKGSQSNKEVNNLGGNLTDEVNKLIWILNPSVYEQVTVYNTGWWGEVSEIRGK